MRREISDSDYAALAELRRRIRQFLRGSDAAAEAAGLEPQQYQMLLALRALPRNQEASIGRLADCLLVRHHSAVELIDRLETRGWVSRRRNRQDQRKVWVHLLPRGEYALERVVRERLDELDGCGDALASSITKILKSNRSGRARRGTLRFATHVKGSKRKQAIGAKGGRRRER